MPDRKITTEPRQLESLLQEIIDRLDRIDGGGTVAGWPSFPERIQLGDGALVIRHTTDVDPTRPPGELELLFVNTVPFPSGTAPLSLGIIP